MAVLRENIFCLLVNLGQALDQHLFDIVKTASELLTHVGRRKRVSRDGSERPHMICTQVFCFCRKMLDLGIGVIPS